MTDLTLNFFASLIHVMLRLVGVALVLFIAAQLSDLHIRFVSCFLLSSLQYVLERDAKVLNQVWMIEQLRTVIKQIREPKQ